MLLLGHNLFGAVVHKSNTIWSYIYIFFSLLHNFPFNFIEFFLLYEGWYNFLPYFSYNIMHGKSSIFYLEIVYKYFLIIRWREPNNMKNKIRNVQCVFLLLCFLDFRALLFLEKTLLHEKIKPWEIEGVCVFALKIQRPNNWLCK